VPGWAVGILYPFPLSLLEQWPEKLFLHVVFDIEIPHKWLQHILKEASKAVKATCSFAINNGFSTAFIIWITCLNRLMISTTLTISRSLVFTSYYNSTSLAGLITIAPETWPMEGSSRNFFIEKWLLVSRPQGNHLHLKDLCKCHWPWALIWIWKECVRNHTHWRKEVKIGARKSEAVRHWAPGEHGTNQWLSEMWPLYMS